VKKSFPLLVCTSRDGALPTSEQAGKHPPLQPEGATGDCGKINSVGFSSVDKTSAQKIVEKDDTNAAAATQMALPHPPPTTPTQATLHLCYDEDGNAYYFNEMTGEPTVFRSCIVEIVEQSRGALTVWSLGGDYALRRIATKH